MPDSRRVHVTKHGDQWATKREGAERASGLHKTQAEAIKQGQGLAKQDKGELIVHREDGKIREERTYRKDPFPPRG